MAFCFGTAPEVAGFIVAYRLANLCRRLLGEGALASSFVPHFESLRGESSERAVGFYHSAAGSLGLVALSVVLGLEGVFWGLIQILPPDWAPIAYLAMWMAPGLFFICLYALNSAFLQCHSKYFLSAAAPMAFNVIWIGAALTASRWPIEQAMLFLAAGVTAAFFFQWALTAWQTRKIAGSASGKREFFSSDWKKLWKPLSLGIIGVGAVQINSALDVIFAKFADPSGPTYLWYAIRIEQLPLSLFGIALSGALLPPLARAAQAGDGERYLAFLRAAIRYSAALLIPCSFGMLALGRSGLSLLYEHGRFHGADVEKTLLCLWGYGIGLVPAVFVLLLANGFYARKMYRVPTIASVLAVAVNIFLNAILVFVFHWGAASIAVATSLSAVVNCLILAAGTSVFDQAIVRYLGKVFLCGLVPTAVVFMADALLFAGAEGGFAGRIGQFGLLAILFLAGYASMAWRLGIAEALELLRRKRPALDA